MISYFPPIRGWMDYTPVIPKFYWDVHSAEEGVKNLSREVDKILHYLDIIQRIVNANDSYLQSEIDSIFNTLTSIQEQIEYLNDAIGSITDDLPTYDVTQGKYVDSREAMRNLYRELAVFGLRETQIEDWTVEQLAQYKVDELSAIGNYSILGNSEPRITDPSTGLDY